MSIRVEPCEWSINVDCCQSTWDEATPDRKAFVTSVATELIWRLSGRLYGLCGVTVRPCRTSCHSGQDNGPPYATAFWPTYQGGDWLNMTCGSCKSGCACSEVQEVKLPGPVDSVTEVRVDGVILPPAAYRVDNHRLLVRTDGEVWPTCQDMTADVGEPGAFSVSYVRGIPVPPGGLAAAGAYACELLRSCLGMSCRLPRRVQSITREGVTMAFLDPFDFLEKGRTGLPEVDVWLAAVNPTGRRTKPTVWSPDLPDNRYRTS